MAKELARAVGYRYVDSGAMYRAVTLYALEHGMIVDGVPDAESLAAALPDIHIDFISTPDGQHTMLNGRDVERDIRSLKVSSAVSPVAAIPAVRHELVKKQQEFGNEKGIVMDGRDIGTTVFPDAELKIYVTASPETRARRRYKELMDKGTDASLTYEDVLANVIDRDNIDMNRSESPLRRAADAIDLDNSLMTVAEQNQWLLDRFNEIVTR